jgi:hypothetical protein
MPSNDDQPTDPGQPTGARMERSLRKRGFQTDKLTLSIARNQAALERFVELYGFQSLLSSQMRSMVAAMSSQECGHFIEFLQLSMHVGRDSMQTRRNWLKRRPPENEHLSYLAAVVDKPEIVEGRGRAIFQSLSPEAQRLAAMVLITAWGAAKQSPSLDDFFIKSDVVDRMVEQLEGDPTVM